MKKLFLLIFCSLIASQTNLQSEIVIDKDNFPFETTYTHSWTVSHQSDLQPPTLGENQQWDLTNLSVDMFNSLEYYDAAGDEYYVDATYYYENQYITSQFPIQTLDFYKIDDEGFTMEGRRIDEITYSITQITGKSGDELKIIGGNVPYVGRGNFVKFPMKFGDTWTDEYAVPANFELTVQDYGLNQTPGAIIQYRTHTRSVVGSGQITMPDANGQNITIDALLIKVENTAVDSVYLGGQPAPTPLMDAFGLVQGSGYTEELYVFYAPGYSVSIATYDMDDSFISLSSITASTTNVENNTSQNILLYPNPSEGIFTIENNNDYKLLSVYDIAGKLVYQVDITGQKSKNIDMSKVTTGTYTIKLDGKNNSYSTQLVIK